MNPLRIVAMPTEDARAYQRGALDANGQPPERHTSTGFGNPCRHCLKNIDAGEEMLILAYRPFDAPQPYAEVGPVFLHAKECERHEEDAGMPSMFEQWGTLLVKGYSDRDRIQYHSFRHIPGGEMETQCAEMLEDDSVKYLHVRTSQYNCFQCRVERASTSTA